MSGEYHGRREVVEFLRRTGLETDGTYGSKLHTVHRERRVGSRRLPRVGHAKRHRSRRRPGVRHPLRGRHVEGSHRRAARRRVRCVLGLSRSTRPTCGAVRGAAGGDARAYGARPTSARRATPHVRAAGRRVPRRARRRARGRVRRHLSLRRRARRAEADVRRARAAAAGSAGACSSSSRSTRARSATPARARDGRPPAGVRRPLRSAGFERIPCYPPYSAGAQPLLREAALGRVACSKSCSQRV